jgi:hypothetical protein
VAGGVFYAGLFVRMDIACNFFETKSSPARTLRTFKNVRGA